MNDIDMKIVEESIVAYVLFIQTYLESDLYKDAEVQFDRG